MNGANIFNLGAGHLSVPFGVRNLATMKTGWSRTIKVIVGELKDCASDKSCPELCSAHIALTTYTYTLSIYVIEIVRSDILK